MRVCYGIDCNRRPRNREHHFCSQCWYIVPPILKKNYYIARGSGRQSSVDKAITNVIRFLSRRDNVNQR